MGNCYETQHTDREAREKCKKVAKCGLCDGDHSSFSKQCPVYVQEKEIVMIRVQQKIPHTKARSIFFKGNSLGKRSYATSLRNKPPENKPPNDASTASTSSYNGPGGQINEIKPETESKRKKEEQKIWKN